MNEQVRISNGELFIVSSYNNKFNQFIGEPFLDLDGNTVEFKNGRKDDPSIKTSAEKWIIENIKPEKVRESLRTKLFGYEYDPNDYFNE